jgi:hypothetical protein
MVALEQTMVVPQSREITVRLPESVSVGSTVTFTVGIVLPSQRPSIEHLRGTLGPMDLSDIRDEKDRF